MCMHAVKRFFLFFVFYAGVWSKANYVAALVDGRSFGLIKGYKPYQKVSPASLTKLMTLYLLFEALDRKIVTLDSVWSASLNASHQPPTHWGLKVGQKVTVRQCVLGIAVRSCNDMAVLVAEKLCGSVRRFVHSMNQKAQSLGLKNTRFCNPSGLYSVHQYSTAYDMAVLIGKLCRHFPKYASCLGIHTFPHHKQRLNNTNKLLDKVPGMCAGKTGFTSLSGWNLATVTVRNHQPMIAVVMGMNNAQVRNHHMKRLIESFYRCPGHLPRVLRAPTIHKQSNKGLMMKKKNVIDKKASVSIKKKPIQKKCRIKIRTVPTPKRRPR